VTLRTRLTLALLLVSLIPLAILTLFTLERLDRALRAWNTPGVERALDSSLEVGKTSLARLEALVRSQGERWTRELPPGPLTEQSRALLRRGLRETALDVAQVYRHGASGWALEEDVRPERVLAATPVELGGELEMAIATGHVVRSDRGLLGSVWPLGPDRVLVIGILVPQGFFGEVRTIGEGVYYYRRFGVVRDLSRLYLILLVATLFVVLTITAALAARSLATDMTRPLHDLAGAVQRVSAGDLDARVKPTGAREFVMLATRFNEMAARLADARDQLKAAEREAAWREVANRLAHEFKNLLTPMGAAHHRLQRRAESLPEPERDVATASLALLGRSLSQLGRLATQFAQYARLPEPRLEAVDLGDVVRSAVAMVEHEGVQVSVVGDGALTVMGDPLLLSRAVHNLVLNACEASPPGATVDVGWRADERKAVVEVLDRGPGLAAEVRARLFQPYVSTKKRGSGVGLSLVRDMAEQHGGTITLEDRPGGGTRARLVLPLGGTPAGRDGDANGEGSA
jgi:nitrogen fixation/metabolism regulation signal transduction histidine kinase